MARSPSASVPALSSARSPGADSKRPRTQEERRTETRGRLLNAAVELLAKKGYSRFRIVDAGAAAGISRGGQTHYFATKNDLLEAAIEYVFDSAAGTIRIEALRDFAGDVLTRAVAQTDEFLRSNVYKVSLNMLITAGVDAHLADRVRAISRRNRGPSERAWIDRLNRSGVEAETAEDALWLMWSVQRGVISDELIGGNTRPPEGLMQFATELMAEVIGSEAPLSEADPPRPSDRAGAPAGAADADDN